jgi:hypothetical protein
LRIDPRGAAPQDAAGEIEAPAGGDPVNGRRVRLRLSAGLFAVAVFCLAASVAAAGKGSPTPKSGAYSGLAGPDLINFTVSPDGGSITNFDTTFNLAVLCDIPAGTTHERFPTLTIRNRHFEGSIAIETAGSTEHLAVQGKFVSATKVTGKLSGHFTIKSLPPCHGSSTFSAQRKGK